MNPPDRSDFGGEKGMQEYRGRQKKKNKRPGRILRPVLIAVLICTLSIGLAVLIRYAVDLWSVRSVGTELAEIYYNESLPAPESTAAEPSSEETEAVAAETQAPASSAMNPGESNEPEAAGSTAKKLPVLPYPENPGKSIAPRFISLREKNKDIIGWLELDHLMKNAVVQRDNVFYLTHDAQKKENVNGALFLDAAVSLDTRPYTILIYGHNMRSGEMFGCLRNYETLNYYKKSPFFSFDSLYEEGRYVIFSAGRISVAEDQPHYIDPLSMFSVKTDERQQVINALRSFSVFRCGVDVQPEDQLLLLITCVDQDDMRRAVAARRLREGESEEDLFRLIQQTAVWNQN